MTTFYEKEAIRLAAENQSLKIELARMRGIIKGIRIFAGDNLPAAAGLSLVHTLDKALKDVDSYRFPSAERAKAASTQEDR